MRRSYALLLPLVVAAGARAQGMTVAEFEQSFRYQNGTITLPGGIATVYLTGNFRYLGPDEAERLLVDGWGNPPGAKTLGMILPVGVSPFSDEGWGVVITYLDDGHVKDDDAATLDYDALLRQMQSDAVQANPERVKAGYEPIELVGWAARPHYDAAAKKLYWAQELKFGDDGSEHTLNYDVRVLGRRGVLSLNAVGSMGQLAEIERDMQSVLGIVEFNEGHRYADFTSGDRVAGYGIGALVAGTVAAKTGLLKAILIGLLAAKKAVVAGLVALGAVIARLFGRRGKESPRPTT